MLVDSVRRHGDCGDIGTRKISDKRSQIGYQILETYRHFSTYADFGCEMSNNAISFFPPSQLEQTHRDFLIQKEYSYLRQASTMNWRPPIQYITMPHESLSDLPSTPGLVTERLLVEGPKGDGRPENWFRIDVIPPHRRIADVAFNDNDDFEDV